MMKISHWAWHQEALDYYLQMNAYNLMKRELEDIKQNGMRDRFVPLNRHIRDALGTYFVHWCVQRQVALFEKLFSCFFVFCTDL